MLTEAPCQTFAFLSAQMVFGKDYTLDRFHKWHKAKVIKGIRRWTRLQLPRDRLRDFEHATSRIQYVFRLSLRASAVPAVQKVLRPYLLYSFWANTTQQVWLYSTLLWLSPKVKPN